MSSILQEDEKKVGERKKTVALSVVLNKLNQLHQKIYSQPTLRLCYLIGPIANCTLISRVKTRARWVRGVAGYKIYVARSCPEPLVVVPLR